MARTSRTPSTADRLAKCYPGDFWPLQLIPFSSPDSGGSNAGKKPVAVTAWNAIPAKRRQNHEHPSSVLADMAEHVEGGGNIALATDTGYIALDFDTPDAVTRAKAACKAWKCSPPYATTAHGIHMLFRLPLEFALMQSPNKVHWDLGAELLCDIRAFGAAIVVWPSVHAGCERLKPHDPREDCHRDYACAGTRYRWRRALPADPAEVPLLPDAWLDAVEEGAGDGPALEYTRDGTVLVLSVSNRTRICTGHLELRAIIETPDKGDLREFVVRPVNGRGRTIVMLATGDQLAEPKGMKKLFARAGSYRWFGSDPELDALAMLENDRPRYLALDHCGRLDRTRAIALGTGLYADGALLEIPDTGRVTIPDAGPDGADLGVQLRGAEVGGALDSLPRVRTTGTGDSVAKVADIMYGAWGIEGVLALAWSCVAPCAVEFRARYPGAGFPLLWVTGERGSGKTALASVACQVWGMQVQQGAQTTPNALVRLLGFYGGLPVALDDARPKSLARMLETILGATTGTGGTRGDATDMRGVHRMRARAVAAVISESAPSDPAAASRSMVLALSRSSHDASTRTAIHSLHALAPAVGHHVAVVLTGTVIDHDAEAAGAGAPVTQSGVFARPDGELDGFAAVQRFARWADEALLAAGLEDSRQRGDVWAPAIAGIHLLGMCSAELSLTPWLKEATAFAVAAELAVRASDWVVEFLADVSDMAHANRLMGGIARYARTEADADLEVNVLWLNLSTLVGEWLRERRSQGREAFVSALDLRGYLEAKPYCWHGPPPEGTSRKYHRLGVEGHRGQPVSCWGVLLEREDTPPGATAIALQLGDPNIAQSSGAEPPPNF